MMVLENQKQRRWSLMRYSAGLFIGALILFPGISAADGTLETTELEKILIQQPTVYEALLSSITLSDTALAKIRLGSHFKNLSGARLGPYIIPGKLKSAQKKIDVVLCTNVEFIGKNGKKLTEMKIEEAVEIHESLTTVVLRETALTWPTCP